jgi:hypothetical protein
MKLRALHLPRALEPQLQSIFFYLFWRWDLRNYLLGLASNISPPDLPSRWYYRYEQILLGCQNIFKKENCEESF